MSKENLISYVGQPRFTKDRLYEYTPPGVIMGLSWTEMGGAAIYIEARLRHKLKNSKPSVESSMEIVKN